MMSQLDIFFYVFVLLLGLIFGSFTNVLISRVPLKNSLLTPSACPNCHAPIKAWQNIPVLSYLLLRGKCATCKTKINITYPLVELTTGLLFIAISFRFLGFDALIGLSTNWQILLPLLAFLYLTIVSIALFVIDLNTHTLPNRLVYPAYIVPLILFGAYAILQNNYQPLLNALIGFAIMFGFYFVLALLYPAGMGFGDVKFAGVIGIYLGWISWQHASLGLFLPFLLAGIFAIGLLIFTKSGRKKAIAFGPWMILGAFIAIIGGTELLSWYWELVT